jgi:hypothetical protein
MSKKRASFLKPAEQLVAEGPQYVPPETMAVSTPLDAETARMEAEEDQRRKVMEGEYRARNRARTLLSLEVTRTSSPSERLRIVLPEGCPFGLRWCDEEYRDKMGMDIWTAVTAEEFEDLKQYVNADQVRVRENGLVMAGRLFLAKAPRAKLEARNALHYQRSQRNLKQASEGQTPLMRRTGQGEHSAAVPAGLSTGQLEERVNRSGGDPLVKFTSQLRDDSLKGY